MIRHYRDDDRESVQRLIVDFQEYERVINKDWKPGVEIAGPYLDYLLDHVKSDNGVMLVGEFEGRVCGYAAAWVEKTESQFCSYLPSFWRLSDIYVDANTRKNGFGKSLMIEAESCGRARGQTRIVLDVLSQNTLARDLYFKLGFTDYEISMVKKI